MHLELKCSNRHCGAIVQEYELLEGDLCPYCYGEDLFEREAEESDVNGYHVNSFGELIPHAVTVSPIDAKTITDELANAVLIV